MALDFLSGKAKTAITASISLIVVLSILAAIMPDVFTAVGDINDVFSSVGEPNGSDLNNSVANSISPVFPILIGLSVLLGTVTFILRSTDFGRNRGGGRF